MKSMLRLILLLFFLLPTVSASADSISYLDEEGTVKHADCVLLTDETDWGVPGDTRWYAAKGNVTISERISIFGDVNLILTDGSVLSAKKGIDLCDGNRLSIWAQQQATGCLTAYGVNHAAGIGGSQYIRAESLPNAGELILYGGKIHAEGGDYAAGIGGAAGIGFGGKGGALTVYGGQIEAVGGQYSAGIGGAQYADVYNQDETASGGSLLLIDGDVLATGGRLGAGIGGGCCGPGGQITISNGTLEAIGGFGAPGIGSDRANAGTILIKGGSVVATGGEASGIGGYGGGSLQIVEGTVMAKGIALGHGVGLSGGDITVKGGELIALGGDSISCGLSSHSLYVSAGSLKATALSSFSSGIACRETIQISGGLVTAEAGNRGVAFECEDGEIIISGGNVDARCGKGDGSCGILGNRVILSWSRLNDSIFADSYGGEILLNSVFLLKGTNKKATKENIGGHTIVPDASSWSWFFVLPNGLTTVNANTFSGVKAERIYLPDSCVSIGTCAFANCTNLKRIRIPAGIAYDQIAPDAFDGVSYVVLIGTRGSGAEQYANDSAHPNCEFEAE